MRKEVKVTVLKKPVVYKQHDIYKLYPMPLIRRGEGKSLIVGATSVVSTKHDVRQIIDPEQIAKLSDLYHTAKEAMDALSAASEIAFESAPFFTDDEITDISELVTEAMAVKTD